MTGQEPADVAALQAVLSCAAKACACFRLGLPRLGTDALHAAAEAATAAFPPGSPPAAAVARLLDVVEQAGDDAEFRAVVAGLTGGAL